MLGSSSLDAKIWHGHWPIIRRGVSTATLSQPIYKIKEPGGVVAESFDRRTRKAINNSIENDLKHRSCVAPIRLEKAIKAFHGYGEWDFMFDELLFEKVEISNTLVASI